MLIFFRIIQGLTLLKISTRLWTPLNIISQKYNLSNVEPSEFFFLKTRSTVIVHNMLLDHSTTEGRWTQLLIHKIITLALVIFLTKNLALWFIKSFHWHWWFSEGEFCIYFYVLFHLCVYQCVPFFCLYFFSLKSFNLSLLSLFTVARNPKKIEEELIQISVCDCSLQFISLERENIWKL